ncbi:hypothetical protein NPIL_523031 [Nephila pilipes]|uniref:Uncharacterized protein n=1 Tax=Nephila pilipes TaxID=299642 RepID=A0A8X6KGF3_NEPPI|nr:hypothetical protein NPIL_523031 [Nephila pilipes]
MPSHTKPLFIQWFRALIVHNIGIHKQRGKHCSEISRCLYRNQQNESLVRVCTIIVCVKTPSPTPLGVEKRVGEEATVSFNPTLISRRQIFCLLRFGNINPTVCQHPRSTLEWKKASPSTAASVSNQCHLI